MTFEDRLDHSIQMQQEHAIDLYTDFFDVKKIIEVDVLGQNNGDIKSLDFSGIDKIVITDDARTIHIAQRFRREYEQDGEWKAPDFSLRIDSYNDGVTEYEKLKKAHYGIGSMPDMYGFGRMPFGRQPAIQEGFDEFYLINLKRLVAKHFDGGLEAEGPYPNGDGSRGLYFELSDIRKHNCMIHEWNSLNMEPKTQTTGLDRYV
jgi:hypothetical protein